MSDQHPQTVVRYHTAGRRQPMLIGKDAAGRRLPGGPYTVYQILAVAAVATAMWQTRTLWATEMTGLSSLLVIGAAAIGAGFLTGRLDFSGRNPLWILLALLEAAPVLACARPGTVGGRPLPASRPRQVRSHAIAAHRPPRANHQPGPATTDPAAPPPPSLLEVESAAAPELAPATQSHGSVQPDGVPAVRLTPLETFLAAAGKVH